MHKPENPFRPDPHRIHDRGTPPASRGCTVSPPVPEDAEHFAVRQRESATGGDSCRWFRSPRDVGAQAERIFATAEDRHVRTPSRQA